MSTTTFDQSDPDDDIVIKLENAYPDALLYNEIEEPSILILAAEEIKRLRSILF